MLWIRSINLPPGSGPIFQRFKESKKSLIFYNIHLFTTLLITYFLHCPQICTGRIRDQAVSAIYWPPGSGFLIQDNGSADSDPKEIITDPQLWWLLTKKFMNN